MSEIFTPALLDMKRRGASHFGPMSFRGYLQFHRLSQRNTAQIISIDSLSRLNGELRKAGVMVFRLGKADDGRTTQFALARVFGGWSDYFFIDEVAFSGCTPEVYIPDVSYSQLYAFALLPILTETSLVNLAVSSGLISHALKLDKDCKTSIPATGQTSLTFTFGPHRNMDVMWKHNLGQVEIDAIFTGRRDGKECLFLVEAKAGDQYDSLAKHKLLYPLLAVRTKVPTYMNIVPVYVRATKRPEGIHFHIAECEYKGSLDESVRLDRLCVKTSGIYVLAGMGTY